MNDPIAEGLNAVRCACLMRVLCDLQRNMLNDPGFKNLEFSPVSVDDRMYADLHDDMLPSDNPDVCAYYALDIVVGKPSFVDSEDFAYTQVFVMLDDELVGHVVIDEATTRIEDRSRVDMDGIINNLKTLLAARRLSVKVDMSEEDWEF